MKWRAYGIHLALGEGGGEPGDGEVQPGADGPLAAGGARGQADDKDNERKERQPLRGEHERDTEHFHRSRGAEGGPGARPPTVPDHEERGALHLGVCAVAARAAGAGALRDHRQRRVGVIG